MKNKTVYASEIAHGKWSLLPSTMMCVIPGDPNGTWRKLTVDNSPLPLSITHRLLVRHHLLISA